MSSVDNIDNLSNNRADTSTIISKLQNMATTGGKPSEMLRYLVLDQKIEQQLELMKIFTEAFDVSLGEVTAVAGWWHDDSAEMNDNDINAYISPLVNDYVVGQSILGC